MIKVFEKYMQGNNKATLNSKEFGKLLFLESENCKREIQISSFSVELR